jgi:selenocysteine lyase/cysteine desulfurase
MTQTFDVTALRKHFPALDKKQVYFDNAGGSQVIQEVIDSVSEYLGGTNVQLGASYPIAQKSTNLFAAGKDAVAKYINASSDEVGKNIQDRRHVGKRLTRSATKSSVPQQPNSSAISL